MGAAASGPAQGCSFAHGLPTSAGLPGPFLRAERDGVKGTGQGAEREEAAAKRFLTCPELNENRGGQASLFHMWKLRHTVGRGAQGGGAVGSGAGPGPGFLSPGCGPGAAQFRDGRRVAPSFSCFHVCLNVFLSHPLGWKRSPQGRPEKPGGLSGQQRTQSSGKHRAR